MNIKSAVILIYCGFVLMPCAIMGQITQSNDDTGKILNSNFPFLRSQAVDAYNGGNYEEAAKLYRQMLERNIDDNVSFYNLACCYGLLNKPSLAGTFLKQAIETGFDDFELLTRDSDFDTVKKSAVFSSLYDSLIAGHELDMAALGNEIFFDACAIFRCRSHLPEKFDKTKTYPLVLGLHGYGGSADYMIKMWQHFDQPEFIYVAPYGPYHFMIGNSQAYSWNLWLTEGEEFPGEDFYITENFIIKLLNDLKSVYNIGDIYLMGHSQGASTSYITGIKHHELFKGIIAISGPLNMYWLDKTTLDAGNNLDVLIVHGKNDQEIFYAEGVAAKNLLTQHGYNPGFIAHNGGHRLPSESILKQIGEWSENKE
ncbi:MAG: hypothetical protein GY839_03260 [candidate division Zixibacteria bacterium]|nr:hypothetical protein [candidate division Zixibacteria bacterium]